MNSTFERNTFVKKVLIVVGIVTFVWVALQILPSLLDIILLVFAGVLIAIFLRGLADLTRRYTKLSEGLSVLLVSVLLLAILGGAIALLAPSVGKQITHLREELPNSAKQAGAYISQYGWGRTLIDQMPSTDEITANIDASTVLSRVGGYFSSTLGALGNFFVMILLAIYLAIEPQFYADGFTKLFPKGVRPRVREVLDTIAETLSWWLIGKAASMLFIGLADVDRFIYFRCAAVFDARFNRRTAVVYSEFRSDSVCRSRDVAGFY